jgi:hypothetical protein
MVLLGKHYVRDTEVEEFLFIEAGMVGTILGPLEYQLRQSGPQVDK